MNAEEKERRRWDGIMLIARAWVTAIDQKRFDDADRIYALMEDGIERSHKHSSICRKCLRFDDLRRHRHTCPSDPVPAAGISLEALAIIHQDAAAREAVRAGVSRDVEANADAIVAQRYAELHAHMARCYLDLDDEGIP